MRLRNLALILLFASGTTSADPVPLLATPRAGLSSSALALPAGLYLEMHPLFAESEQSALSKLGAGSLSGTYVVTAVSRQAADQLKAWALRNSPGWAVDENSGVALRDGGVDPLTPYQWGLENRGDTQELPVSFQTTDGVPGRAGQDLGVLRAEKTHPEPTPASPVIVAVLDTGIDPTHPDLKPQLLTKTGPGQECDPATLPKRQSDYKMCVLQKQPDCIKRFDLDGDGYPLDCQGWNLTTAQADATTGLLGDANTLDDAGHGTHVAGIIGAQINGKGLRGVDQNVKILPVRVVQTSPNPPRLGQSVESIDSLAGTRDLIANPLTSDDHVPAPLENEINPQGAPIGFVDRVARGMLYAIRAGAKVVNMSLAWPPSADSELMRQMVALAQSQGILVVASAGNDSTEAETLPCAYPGVICVASYDPDGAFSSFSNFGDAVDIAGPGLSILSAWPTYMSSGRQFTMDVGYEWKSGTSMAAPFVVGALARLLEAGYSPEEARSRLMVSARPVQSALGGSIDPTTPGKTVRTGDADLALALDVSAQPYLEQVDKGPQTLVWDLHSDSLSLELNLRNAWAPAKNAKVSLDLPNASGPDADPTLTQAGASLETSHWSFDTWQTGETKTLATRLKLSAARGARLKLNGRFTLSLTLDDGAGHVRAEMLPIEVVSRIDAATDVSLLPAGAEKLPVIAGSGSLGTIGPSVDIRSVSALDGVATQDYLTIDSSQAENSVISLYQEQHPPASQVGYALKAQAQLARISGSVLLLAQRLDWSLSGVPGYVLIYQTPHPSDSTISGIRFEFFDAFLAHRRSIAYDDVVSSVPDRFQWMKLTDPVTKVPLLLPSWVGVGLLPKPEYPPRDKFSKLYCGDSGAQWKKKQGTPAWNRAVATAIDVMKANHWDTLRVSRAYYLDTQGQVHTLAVDPCSASKDFVPVSVLAASRADAAAGVVPVLLARQLLDAREQPTNILDYAWAKLHGADLAESELQPFAVSPYRTLVQVGNVGDLLPLGRGSPASGTYFGLPAERGMLETTFVTTAGAVDTVTNTANPPARTDSVFRVAAAFQGANRSATFSETHYDLQYDEFDGQGGSQTQRISLGRFSFLPQVIVSQSLFGTQVQDLENPSGELLPAILIPSQLRSSANLEVVLPAHDASGRLERLITPARLRLQSGDGCRTLGNLVPAFADSPAKVVFLCGDHFIRVPLAY